MSKFKDVVFFIMSVVGLIGIVVAFVMYTVFRWQNPDMTEYRVFLEYPLPAIVSVISAILYGTGRYLLSK